MGKLYSRTPKHYDGTGLTCKSMTELLPGVLARIGEVYQQRPDLILAMWPDLVGPQVAQMTQAVSFIDETLFVKVKNSTLHSILNGKAKSDILLLLRKKFPNTPIKGVCFRIG